jgi:glycosyltransferase involved in cell wall biosynthesis
MKISIVTTSFNHAEFLEEALVSVQRQGGEDVEHIVVDGGSNDGTVELLKSKRGAAWSHLRWISEEDEGQTQAMNKGLRMATGDVIGWLNSDDRYRPGCFAAVEQALHEGPAVDVLYGDYTLMGTDGAHLRTRREIEFSRLVLLYHRVLYIPTTSSFFRRRIFDEGNWLDESMQYAMDHEFYVRLAMKGYRFRHIRKVLADFRMHPASKTSTMAWRQIAESYATMQRYSTVAQRVRPVLLRDACISSLRVAAGAARYTEKLLRGYYLPERWARTWAERAEETCT